MPDTVTAHGAGFVALGAAIRETLFPSQEKRLMAPCREDTPKSALQPGDDPAPVS